MIEWPLFEKSYSFGLLYVFFVFGLFVTLVIQGQDFMDRIQALIVPVPGHCILFAYLLYPS